MAIFQDPELTKEEIIKREVRGINRQVDFAIGLSEDLTKKLFDMFWNNPSATPMELAEAYGVNAVLLFQKLAIWQGAIAQVDPSFTPFSVPEKYEYEINQDGTVTITEKV